MLKSLRLIGEIFRGGLTLAWYFPRLNQDQRLGEIQQWANRILRILDVEVQYAGGAPLVRPCLVVANHVSWLDILVLQSLAPGVFVAKAEVRRWPVFGAMAQACSTIFVERLSLRSTHAMVESTVAAFSQGLRVLGFPEGTSSNGSTVGIFHANLFEGAIRTGTPVQPLALQYVHAGTGSPTDAPVFIGDMGLLTSIRRVIGSPPMAAQVQVGECIAPEGCTRKTLARQAQHSVEALRSQKCHLDR